MPSPSKQYKIDQLTLSCQSYQQRNAQVEHELKGLKARVTEIAAENESLRMDKKWLQQMHSAVLQSMHEFVRGRNH